MADFKLLPPPANQQQTADEIHRNEYPAMTIELAKYMYGTTPARHEIKRGRYTQVYPVPIPHESNIHYSLVETARRRRTEAIGVARQNDLIERMARIAEIASSRFLRR